MSNSRFEDGAVLSARQTGELDHALERNGGSAAFIKWLSEGDNLRGPIEVWKGTAKIVPLPLLDFGDDLLLIPMATESFEASKHFIVDTSDSAEVKICDLWGFFKEEFLGKTEEPCPASALRRATLTRPSVDGPIIEELGGEEKAETTLLEFFKALKAQRAGETGALFTDGRANIFYIKNKKDVLRTVYASWRADGGGWRVSALGVAGPRQWYAGDQVFSRSSRLASAA
jgi:hypothetical protein